MAVVRGENFRLIVFDVEGVLIPKNRYLLFEIGKRLNFLQFLRIVFYGILYELGLISLKTALEKVFKIFRSFKVEELLQIFRQIPLMPNVEEVFEELRREGWKTALISSGLPTFVVEDLASRLKADYAFGFDLKTRDGIVTGEISGEVIEPQGKLLVLKRIVEAEGESPEKLVVVADDRNNAPILLPEAVKIGYNPDFLMRIKADHVVTENLVEILPLIGVEESRKGVSFSKSTIFREAIHACGFTVPFLSGLVGKYAVALLIVAVTFLYVASEVAMMEGRRVPIISWIVRHAATKAELHEFATAPIFFALGILFTLLLFPISVSNAAIATFALGDSAAAIVGKTIGRKRLYFNKGKTFEGLAAGLFAGFLAALVYVNPLEALAAAATATVVESLPLPISDNLTIPLITAIVLTLIA